MTTSAEETTPSGSSDAVIALDTENESRERAPAGTKVRTSVAALVSWLSGRKWSSIFANAEVFLSQGFGFDADTKRSQQSVYTTFGFAVLVDVSPFWGCYANST